MEEKICYYETENWKVLLHSNQAYLGYSVILCKKRVPSLSELSIKQWKEFYELVKVLEFSYKNIFGATLFNWTCLMNNEYKSNNPKPHVHWHMRPRYRNEVKFAGEIFKDEEFAHHYNKHREHIVSIKVQELIAKEVKKITIDGKK